MWFSHGEWLFVTERTEPTTPRIATAAVNALLSGPTAEEQAAGSARRSPRGPSCSTYRSTAGIATVNLSRAFASGGGSLSMFGRLAQLTYTLTQFPTVQGVILELDGEAGHGLQR